ncbi:hypothetical protein C0J52_04515 [Blattella germanica]|nr:hypothetical protein C0J52_04515 [Blattella germanica]
MYNFLKIKLRDIKLVPMERETQKVIVIVSLLATTMTYKISHCTLLRIGSKVCSLTDGRPEVFLLHMHPLALKTEYHFRIEGPLG